MSDTTATAPRFIRMPEVCRRIGLSPRQIYRMIGEDRFPKQRRLSHRHAVWREDEVVKWQVDKLAEDLLA